MNSVRVTGAVDVRAQRISLGRAAAAVAVLIASCEVNEPTPRVSLSDAAGRWIGIDSTTHQLDTSGRVGIPQLDTTTYRISPDTFSVVRKQRLLDQLFTSVWQGLVIAESTYVDIAHRQVVTVRFHEDGSPDSSFSVVYRIEDLIHDSLYLAVIAHDKRLDSLIEVNLYNENATVLEARKLLRLQGAR